MKKNTRRILSAIFAAIILCTVAPISAFAVTDKNAAEDVYQYEIINNEAKITSCSDAATTGTITVPSVLGKYTVTMIAKDAFTNLNCKNIIIPSTVKQIDEFAFSKNYNVVSYTVAKDNASYTSDVYGVLFNKNQTELLAYPCGNPRGGYEIPSTVTNIYGEAFAEALALKYIYVPNDVMRIGPNAFVNSGWWYDQTGYETDGCLYIGNHVIGFNPYATECNIQEGTLTVADYAFYNCQANIVIPESVRSIGAYAFYNCQNIQGLTGKELNLEKYPWCNNLVSIGDFAFYNCPMTVVSFGESLKDVSPYAFAECKNIELFYVDNDNPYYYLDSNSLFVYTADRKTLLLAPRLDLNSDKYLIPDTVIEIAPHAFEYADMASITIPNSVEFIGDSAFANCANLKSVSLPTSLQSIGDYAFYGCIGLSTIIIPNSVTTIGDYAFNTCKNLNRYVIGSNLAKIGAYAFGFNGKTMYKDIQIFCAKDSYGEKYVKAYGIDYKYASDVIGDVNNDGKINSSDALLILQIAVGKGLVEGGKTSVSYNDMLIRADVNLNSQVTSTDALFVLRYSVGLTTSLI